MVLDPIVVLVSVALLVALSIEVISGRDGYFTQSYLNMQLCASLVYILDFFVALTISPRRLKYLSSHIIVLLISLPYLSLLPNQGLSLGHDPALVIGILPQLRACLALYVVLRWIMREHTIKRLFYAYVVSVLSFTYIAALIFYDCEIGKNEAVINFGDALWWATTALATLGNPFLPVTATGKVLSALLPLVGMLMLPIATSYIMAIYKRQ